MEPPFVALDQNFSGASEDFPALLRRKGLINAPAMVDSRARKSARTRMATDRSDHHSGVQV